MTELRQRMLDAMQVRGLSARTQECYVEAVARLTRHYHCSPDLLSPAQVEAYSCTWSSMCMRSWPVGYCLRTRRWMRNGVYCGAGARVPTEGAWGKSRAFIHKKLTSGPKHRQGQS